MKGKRRIAPKAAKVSMVARANSRLPFRVCKGSGDDVDGIDLALLFKGEKTEAEVPADPQLVAVMVSPLVSEAAAVRMVEAAGFAVDQMVKSDDGYVFAQASGDVGPVTMFKVSDEVGVAVANVSKGFCSYVDGLEDLSFAEQVRVSGVYSLMDTARNVLSSTMYEAMEKASTPSEASANAGKAIDAYKGYVTEMLGALPVKVFKAEDIKFEDTDMLNIDTSRPETIEALEAEVTKGSAPGTDKKHKPMAKEDGEETVAASEDAETAAGAEGADTVAGDAGEDTTAGAEGEDTVAKGDEPAAIVAEEPKDVVAKQDGGLDIQAIIDGVSAKLAPQIEAVQQSVTDISARVEQVETVAKSDREKLGKIVPGLAPAEPVKKSELAETSVPHIDTGLGLMGD